MPNTKETIPVTVRILEKEYKISCPVGEHESLMASAQHVNASMKKIRESGKALGAERVAVMAAINIAHELLNTKNAVQNIDTDLSSRIDALQKSIDAVIKPDT